MHYVLVKDDTVVHVWHGAIPKNIPDTYAVAPGSAHVGDRWVAGQAVKQAPTVTIEEINAECERRILEAFPLARQANIIDEGTPGEVDDLRSRRNAFRACARALISMTPIPSNYRDDRFWSGSSFHGALQSSGGGLHQIGHGHGGYGGHPHAMPQHGYGSTNQPIIMMQAPVPPAAAAPIIINGPAPGTTVIQAPQPTITQTPVPQISVVQPAVAGAQPAQSALPAPSSNGLPRQAIDEDEIVYETAGRALAGQEAAIQYMTAIAATKGQEWKGFCEAKLKERFERFDTVLRKAASAA